MVAPRRSRRSQQPPPPQDEEKPKKIDSSKANQEEEEEEDLEEEKFQFSFSEEKLTSKECAQKMDEFQSREELLSYVHPDELNRFTVKSFIGRNGQPMKCFNCTRKYTSASGFLAHLKKCEKTPSNEPDEATLYRRSPSLWLKVDRKEQKVVLNQIAGADNECFVTGCSKKFGTQNALIGHLKKCVKPEYFLYKNRAADFRKLEQKIKMKYIREAITANNGSAECLGCSREFSHSYGLSYHLERCNVEKSEQPWRCYRCGFHATVNESRTHLDECNRDKEASMLDSMDSILEFEGKTDFEISIEAKRRKHDAPRATPRKDGTTLYRYRKSTVNREFNGVVSLADQRKYEAECSKYFESWKTKSLEVPFSNRLTKIGKPQWKPEAASSPRIFARKSVTVVPRKVEGLQHTIPAGVRIAARESVDIESTTVAYCGAPINAIKVAPGKIDDTYDVICVSTFADENDLDSDSSIVQFWKHRINNERSELKLWFLLSLPFRGTVLSTTWLQKHSPSDPDLVGFVAFSTSKGEVLIYRIDSKNTGIGIGIVTAEPNIILKLGNMEKKADYSMMNTTIKVEGEEVDVPDIDESLIPIIKISWCSQNGGRLLAGIDALGAVLIWDLDGDGDGDRNPIRKIEDDWQSPPSDIAWLDAEHIVMGFREKLAKVINVNSWEVKMEENTIKTAGTRVHTDPRIVESFFTFQSEYTAFPYPNATSVSYVNMDVDSKMLVLCPTANTHQLMTWDVAMCPTVGTLLSCGVDGRLLASATGRLLRRGRHSFFANRNLMTLTRRRIQKDPSNISDILKQVKNEDSSLDKTNKEPLEESLADYDAVCSKMWLEMTFDEPFEPVRPEISCRDQRIESLNCVDTNVDPNYPVSFTGGEAGLLFAVPSKLIIRNNFKV
uniref:C2H2-type domain-containing protein n=1 Tax=Caenorhabditis japonica TaxID=281687 RepID=A0A8R1DJF6_CAEJA